jgi:bifunctional non-homologous end joining protein LigD
MQIRAVAEIEFAGWTGDGMVRQAAFKGLREDKPALEVRAERAVPPEELESTAPDKLKSRAASRAKSQSNVVLGTVISNPDKPLWPADSNNDACSKIDLARYLEQIGPWMIRRPKALRRAGYLSANLRISLRR